MKTLVIVAPARLCRRRWRVTGAGSGAGSGAGAGAGAGAGTGAGAGADAGAHVVVVPATSPIFLHFWEDDEPPRASQKVLIPSRKKGPNLSTSPRTIYLLYVIHTMFFPGSYVIPSRKKNSESSHLSCKHTIIYTISFYVSRRVHTVRK